MTVITAGQGHEVAKRTLDGRGRHARTMGVAPTLAGGAPHAHEFVYRGKADDPGSDWCERPNVLRCRCGEVKTARCGATRDDRCRPCAEVHRRDIAAVVRSGAAGDRPEGFFFVTLTGPGADVLPWDREACGHRPGECSGEIGCKVERVAAGAWNATAPQRWSWFMTALRREVGDVQFGGSWEGQKRGVLHRHSLMRSMVSLRKMEAAVRDCAARYGFGVQVDVQSVTASCALEVARRAGYIASYATKGGENLCETFCAATGEVLRGGYRRWSASRRWGSSMRAVKCRRQGWAMARASLGEAAGDGSGALDLYADFYARLLLRFPGSVIVPPAAAAAVAM